MENAMGKKLRVGIAYDVKEDYDISARGCRYCDFSTAEEIEGIKSALERRGHAVCLLGNYRKICAMLAGNAFPELDMVLNTAEGLLSRNREGWLPSLFEMYGIPYTGSDAYTLSLTLNKCHTKIMAGHLGIPTAPYRQIGSLEELEGIEGEIPPPWIIKPNYEGTSSGVRYAEDLPGLRAAAAELLADYRQPLLCEAYIDGREFVTSLLYDGERSKCVGTVEIVRRDGGDIRVFSAEDKLGETCTKVPAVLPGDLLGDMERDALRLHRFLECRDLGRADYRVDREGKYWLLEVTPLPTLSPEGGFGMCCAYAGLDLGYVYEEVLYSALARYRGEVHFGFSPHGLRR